MRPLVVGIVGPTGSGKTELALSLAQRFSVEVISADSMQIYRGLDIGTAKPLIRQRRRVTHHMIDCVRPSRNYSIYRYRQEALSALKKVIRAGRMPLVVGGSGLYVRALFDGLTEYPKINGRLRNRIEGELKREGAASLFRKLEKIDPDRARAIDAQNPRRIVRAYELALVASKRPRKTPVTWPSLSELGYAVKIFGLEMARSILYAKVEERVDRMFRKGWRLEARRLKKKKLGRTVKQAIGYRDLWESSLMRVGSRKAKSAREEFQRVSAQIKKSTRHLVKKQFTWFRRDPRIEWLDVTDENGRRRAVDIMTEAIRKYYANESK